MIDSDHLLGHTLGTCTLSRLLGRGGMGAVFLAQQSRPKRTVAIKVLMPGVFVDTGIRTEFLARFRREADAIAALDQVNIVPVYEYGEQENLAYLVMPHVTGGTLMELLRRRGKLSLPDIVQIIDQAAAALDYAHVRGIIHRDLKPSNMLFHADGRVLLADFGIAKILNETTDANAQAAASVAPLTSAGVVMGTPEYFSPEQSTGNPVDKRTDIYSLGIVLYQMLSGRLPFTGPTVVSIAIKHSIEEPPSLRLIDPTIPHAVEAVVMKAIAKKPEHRYASAGAMAHALHIAAGIDTSQLSGSSSKKTEPEELPTVITFSKEDTVLATPPSSFIAHDAPTMATELPSTPPQTPVHTAGLITPAFQNTQTPIKEAALPPQPRNRRSPWRVLLISLLVFLVIIGGVATALYIISRPAAHPIVVNHPTPIAKPKATPTPKPAPLPPAVIPVGALIYGTALPYCDAGRNNWTTNANATLTCHTTSVELKNTSASALAGAFLDKRPGGVPANYILQVQVSLAAGSQGSFGIFFRKQPGLSHVAAYTFQVFPSGQWQGNYYSAGGGKATIQNSSSTTAMHSLVTLDIYVNGDTYSLYINGQKQGGIVDSNYSGGTIGLLADVGSDVFYQNLAIYALP